MRSRQEQVQAHRFITRRIVSGLLTGEPETTELPMRRFGLALFGSVMVAAIAFAVVGVIGLVNPGGGKPESGELIIMRETGARYVLADNTLHPVLNWSSALLFAGTEAPAVRQMSRDSLSVYPIGAPIGIPGAPDPPPDRGSLLPLPWSVCSSAPSTAAARPTTAVVVGRTPTGGNRLGADGGLLVATPSDSSGPSTLYVIFGDRRYRIPGPRTQTALGLASTTPIVVGKALLNSISAGPTLAAPFVADAGKPSDKRVAGEVGVIGKVYRSGTQRYVLTRYGLATIGEVSAKLLLADDPHEIEISAVEAADATVKQRVETPGFPASLPPIPTRPDGVSMVCAIHDGKQKGDVTATVLHYGSGAEQLPTEAGPGGGQESDGVRTADRVVVASGKGALVKALPAPDVQADTTVYLVTDQGYKHPIRSTGQVNALAALGYAGVAPVPVPSTLLALVPNGPVLDPDAAQRFYRPMPRSSG